MRQAFYKIAPDLLADERVVILIGDVGSYGLRDAFAKYPQRCLNLGAAEQAMVGIAAGLAKEGFYPIVHSFSTFLLRRAYEQIYLDFGVQGLSGLFVGIGENKAWGPSHVCGEDVILVDCIPNMISHEPIIAPTTEAIIRDAVQRRTFAYVRV